MLAALVILLAASIPAIDVSRACHGQENAIPNEEPGAAYRDCMQAQQAARTELGEKWARYPVAAKAPCASLASTFDSYVELLVCVEIRAGNGLGNINRK